MRLFSSPDDSTRQKFVRRLLFACALAIVATVAFFFLRGSDGPVSFAKMREGRGGKAASSYQNRSRLPALPASEREAQALPAIEGNVYGMDGVPIPNALVTATTFELAGNVTSAAGSVKSDEGGHFSLVLPRGTYQLSVSGDGHGPATVTAKSGETVSVLLPDSGVIQGHVRDDKGQPVRQFTIDVIVAVPGDAPATPPVWSRRFESPDGAFRIDALPVWDVIIRATAEGYAPGFTEQLGLSPKATASVDLTLSHGCALTGKVRDSKGVPLPRVFVDAESRLVAGEMTDLSMHAAAQAESDMEGAFQLANVPKGTVMVRGYDGSNAVSTATVEVGECDKLAPVDLVMTEGGGLVGVARDGEGKPLEGAVVSIMSRALGYVSMTTGKDGRYSFEDLAPGVVRVELNHKGNSMLTFSKVSDGGVTEQDITLFGGGKGEIRGRITASGKPLAGARLMIAASRQPAQDISVYNPVTEADGTYSVKSLAPGAYLVNVLTSPQGKGAEIKADEVVNVDLDVAPKPRQGRGQ